jgi:hypothetical protein
MAAAEREYHLKIFQSTVDIEGFDVMLDDNQQARRFQLKTRFNAKTRVLKDIHSVMLMPKRRNANLIRFENGMCPTLDNGLIFIDINYPTDTFIPDIQYFYLDFYILHSISKGIIPWKTHYIEKSKEILERLLISKRKNQRINIPISLFLKLKNASSLLAISGFDSMDKNTLQYFFMNVFAKEITEIDYVAANEEQKQIFKKNYIDIISGLVIKT